MLLGASLSEKQLNRLMLTLVLQHRPLALTQAALSRLIRTPSTADLTQQQQPVELTGILPALAQELQLSQNPSPIAV